MYSRLAVPALLVAAALAPISAGAQGGPPGGAPPPPEVSVVTAELRTVPVNYQYVGVVQASRVSDVRARIEGFISERRFQEGSLVQEGEVLYLIERDRFEAGVAVAKAEVEAAQARLQLAERELERLSSLRNTGAIPASDLDRARAERDSASANLALEQANFRIADLELSYTEVHAPITGLVGKAQRDVGALVDGAQNSLLTTVTAVDPIYVVFSLSERDYLEWNEARTAGTVVLAEGKEMDYQIVLQDGTVYPHVGRMNFIDPSFNPSTGTVELRVSLPNPQDRLKPGQFVRINALNWVRPNTITVPQPAVIQSPTGASVMVVDQTNTLQVRPVKLGGWLGTSEWIVLEGLQPGERVMVQGLMKARPGAPVSPVPYVANAGAAQPLQPAAQTAQAAEGEKGRQ